VIGNGDVVSVESAIEMYEKTGCDLVMIGRGALGNPWLFGQIKAYREEGRRIPPPELPERMDFLLRQVKLAVRYKGEYAALREARSHAAWYLKGMTGAAALRREAGGLRTYEDLQRLVGLALGG
jgi:tRNA-dihydrouridine synthase